MWSLRLGLRFAGLSFSKELPHTFAELGEEDGAHNQTNNNNNNNSNNNNNDNDHNTNIQESSFGSLDLDDDNPESSLSGSEPDLDETGLANFDPNGDEESSLDNLGHQTMTIESSLGSLDQQEEDEQEGMLVETAWDPSLDPTRDSFGRTKPKKRVTFSKATLAAYNEKQQNNRQQQNKGSHPTSSQLEQLEHKEKNNKKDNEWCKTTRACWNEPQQEHQYKQQAWKMQQQP